MTKNKEIVIRYHVIEQFLAKVGIWQSIDEVAVMKKIQTIVKRGEVTSTRPGDACEIEYEGISLVCKVEKNRIIVITCLGDKKYRGWARKNEILPRYKAKSAC